MSRRIDVILTYFQENFNFVHNMFELNTVGLSHIAIKNLTTVKYAKDYDKYHPKII